MSKTLSEKELEELKGLLADRKQVATIVAIIGAVATLVSAVGTAIASIILAMERSNG